MSTNPPKVVVIEDDRDLQFLYQLKLEQSGYNIKIAGNGEDGLQIVEQFQPDIILLDLMMPVMGGAEMLAQLRSHDWGSSIRVIILTNISRDEAPQALRFLRVDRYIVKAHHTPAQVIGVVNEVLGRTAT